MESCSGICGIDYRFVWRCPSSIPAAVAFHPLDAGRVLCLISQVAEVGEHVCPNALILGGGKAGQIVAGPNLQLKREIR